MRGLSTMGFCAPQIDARFAVSAAFPNAIIIQSTSNVFLPVFLCGLSYI
jgi:hypothetical protein